MDQNRRRSAAAGFSLSAIVMIICATTSSTAAGVFISDGAAASTVFSGAGRNLLQALIACDRDMESLNYTIVISKCRAPEYPRAVCCDAFKELACPIQGVLNNATTTCASTFMSNLVTRGGYPGEIFANYCSDSTQGISCAPATASPPPPAASAGGRVIVPALGATAMWALLLGLLLCSPR